MPLSLNETPAVLGLTGTSQFPVVMRVAIVEREFGSGLDGVQGIKLCPFSNDSHEGIWCAGMVDKPESCRLFGPINRLPIIHFDNGNPLLGFSPLSPFSLGNQFSSILPDFLPLSQMDFGE